MKKNAIALSLLMLSTSVESVQRSGFEIATGPGFRQDRVEWQVFFDEPSSVWNQEVYPHLRMFDWMGAIDASVTGVHIQAMGDFGWFSFQPMHKMINSDLNGESNPAVPGRFEFIANGRASTCDVRLAYQIDFPRSQWVFLPFGGWFFNQLILRRTDSLPPFDQTATNVEAPYVLADQSVAFLSKLRQKWSGPVAGAGLIWQPVQPVLFDMNYGYGWLELSQNFEETDSSLLYLSGPTPSTNIQTVIRHGHIHSQGHGHIARCKIGMQLSKSWAFNIDGRYFYLFSDSAQEKAELSVNESPWQTVRQKARAKVNSASLFFELAFLY